MNESLLTQTFHKTKIITVTLRAQITATQEITQIDKTQVNKFRRVVDTETKYKNTNGKAAVLTADMWKNVIPLKGKKTKSYMVAHCQKASS